MESSFREIRLHRAKPPQVFVCHLLHKERGYLVLQYTASDAYTLGGITLDKGTITIAHYWGERNYVLWKFKKPDGAHPRLCRELGRIELIRTMFEATRAINPEATLLLNDFNVSPAYEILIEDCLAAGVQIDVIGIQTHMHQGYWGPERTQSVIKRFERFNLPIHFTENTIVSGHLMPPEIIGLNDYQVSKWPSTPDGEQRQAQEVVLHYKTLLAHPVVQAITWWDLSDGGWLNAPAGLLRQDHFKKLLKQRLQDESANDPEQREKGHRQLLEKLRQSPIAIENRCR